MSKIVDRTLDFFELFAREQRPLTLSEITRLLDIPISSCHDVLGSLQRRGYIYQISQREGFYPTRRVNVIAENVAKHDPTLQHIEERLRWLRDDTGESVTLAKASNNQLTYLLVLDSPNDFSVKTQVGGFVRAFHATSAGKAFLGILPPAERRRYLESSKLEKLTDQTKISIPEILSEIESSAKQGWFTNTEESAAGISTVSASFQLGTAIYVVTIAAPTVRVGNYLGELGAKISTACGELSSDTSAALGIII